MSPDIHLIGEDEEGTHRRLCESSMPRSCFLRLKSPSSIFGNRHIGNVGQKETKRDLVAAPGVLARSFGCDGTLRSS
jgi:hypothetical protein